MPKLGYLPQNPGTRPRHNQVWHINTCTILCRRQGTHAEALHGETFELLGQTDI